MRVLMDYFSFLRFCFSLLLFVRVTTPMNTTQSIRDGDTIVSASGTYELGFFSPGKSKNRYLGVWYGKISVLTAVWVANREAPLNDSSGVARLTNQGLLVLLNRSGSIIWSSNTSTLAKNPVVQLLDSGNLVVKEEGDDNLENSLWQSFEHPGNTLIPGMKIGRNRITGMEWYVTSWKSADDPSRGNITCILVPDGYPEVILLEDSKEKHRAGPWNGLQFSGVPQLKPSPVYTFEFVFNDKEIFYREELKNSSRHWRIVFTQDGDVLHLLWIEQTQSWFLYETSNTDNCESYALCGYISPEYANHGLYSLKSDVFSFGVLVLEIVSGNRNRGFCHPDHRLNLIGHAWILFKQGRPLELAAESKVKTPYLSEVLRSIHVGLLCVQENPENRPNMSYVVLMLGNEDELPQPKQPGFFTERDLVEASCSSSQSKPPSANGCSISVLEAR